jgi:hypothetical protein
MGGYSRDVSAQRLGKHVPAARDANATIEELCRPCRDVISKGKDSQLAVRFCTGVCEGGAGAEEPLPMKTLQAGEDLACSGNGQ